MQLYVTVKPDLPDGGPFAQMNPGTGKPFGVIEFGDNAYVSVKSDDEARRIIAVAARLIEMRQWIGQPHAFERAGADSIVVGGHCIHCGMLGDSPDHAADDEAELPAQTTMCKCGHFEGCHVGAVLGDPDPGQCTAMVDDGDDCECERFRPAAAKAETASTAPARTVSA